MTSELVPSDVSRFILDNIDSVSELEALLLLRRSAGRAWTEEDLSKRIYSDADTAATILTRLTKAGLCVEDRGLFRYHPDTPQQAEIVDRTADLYARYLIPVTNLIHNKPARIQQFANAFLFRKDK